jgi:hypothetical protein
MDVYHDGKLLDNRMDFVSQGVSDGDELIGIKQELTDTFKFYVATMSGAKYFFYVNASYSVLKVKTYAIRSIWTRRQNSAVYI